MAALRYTQKGPCYKLSQSLTFQIEACQKIERWGLQFRNRSSQDRQFQEAERQQDDRRNGDRATGKTGQTGKEVRRIRDGRGR